MAPQKHTYSIILAAVSRLRDDLRWRPRLFNKWLPAETWVKAIEQARLINVDLHIDAAIFNRAMACEISTWRISMLDFKSTNSGFFQVTYKGYKYYYATESGKDVPYPWPLDAKWKEKADEAGAQALIIPVTRSQPAAREDVNDDDDLTRANKKRKRTVDWQSSDAAKYFNNNKEQAYTTPASFYRSLDQ
jgi:hypothetical protein